MKLKSRLFQRIGIPLLIACVVGVCYSSVVVNRYGFYDDYSWLNNTSIGAVFAQGRPLNALFLNIGFSWAKHSIDKLSFLRLISLFGIWGVGMGIYYFCKAHRLTTTTSLTLAFAIILLPSFQVYGSWAITFSLPFSALLGLSAAYFLTPPCTLFDGNWGKKIALSVTLLLLALLIYQPTALVFCAGVTVSLIASVSAGRSWKPHQLLAAATTLVLSLGLGLLAQRLGLWYAYLNAPLRPSGGVDRLALVQDVFGKLSWFFSELLPNAFSLYVVPCSILASGAVLTLITLGAVLYCRRHGRPAWLALTGVVCCMLFAAMPNLATQENWASYRSIVAISATVAVLTVLMVRELGIWAIRIVVRERLLKPIARTLLLVPVVFLVLAGWSAYSNILNGFVFPNVNLLASLERLVKESGKPSSVKVVRLLEGPISASFVHAYDEFGFFFSHVASPTNNMVLLVLRDAGLLEKNGVATSSNDLLLDFSLISLCSNKFTSDVFHPINLIDDFWIKGIRRDKSGFIYDSASNCANSLVRVGDILHFEASGLRRVIKVDESVRPLIVVVTEDPPLIARDGFPHSVIRESP